MRAVYASGAPAFGSCWGIQVGAGRGRRRRCGTNPHGREIGFARRLVPTRGRAARIRCSPAGPAAYDAPAIHLDAVVGPRRPAAPCSPRTVMAGVQAAEIRHDGGVFWGVQYHPEFSLAELASILERRVESSSRKGSARRLEDAAAYVADLRALARRSGAPRPRLAPRARRGGARPGAPHAARSATSSSTA